MDPSEIIAIPYPLDRLNVFVMLPVVFIMVLTLSNAPEKFGSALISLARLTIVVYALLGVCGAYIVQDYKHSLLAALYMASLLWTTTSTDNVSSKILEQLPFHDHSDLLATCRLFGVLIGSIPFQLLQVLDWGVQIQRWPIPIVLGGTFGYVVGSIIGVLLLYIKKPIGEAQARRRE
jgi:hypothetical protein